MMTASSGKNPSGVHFPVYKRSFGAANFVPAYTCSLGVQGSSRSIWSAGDFTDDTYQAKEPVEDLGRWEAGQLPSHPLRRIGRRVAIQWVQRNIQVWAWTSLEGTVVLAIKAAADLDQHKLANGLTLQQNQRKAEHLLDRNSITFDRRKVGVDAR